MRLSGSVKQSASNVVFDVIFLHRSERWRHTGLETIDLGARCVTQRFRIRLIFRFFFHISWIQRHYSLFGHIKKFVEVSSESCFFCLFVCILRVKNVFSVSQLKMFGSSWFSGRPCFPVPVIFLFRLCLLTLYNPVSLKVCSDIKRNPVSPKQTIYQLYVSCKLTPTQIASDWSQNWPESPVLSFISLQSFSFFVSVEADS